MNDYAGQRELIAENMMMSICIDLTKYLQELKQERKTVSLMWSGPGGALCQAGWSPSLQPLVYQKSWIWHVFTGKNCVFKTRYFALNTNTFSHKLACLLSSNTPSSVACQLCCKELLLSSKAAHSHFLGLETVLKRENVNLYHQVINEIYWLTNLIAYIYTSVCLHGDGGRLKEEWKCHCCGRKETLLSVSRGEAWSEKWCAISPWGMHCPTGL